MSKYFWVALVGVVVALGAIFMLSGGKAADTDTGEFAYAEPIPGVQTHDHQLGEGTKATIVEYGDFQCPACAAEFPILKQVEETYGNEVKIVYRHYPIVNAHPQAMAAHRAAEAAARQDMFWEMHDLLFARQQSWSGSTDASSIFEGYARELGLDMEQYAADIVNDSVSSKINSDLDSGNQLGVNSTPTLYLNGEKLDFVPRSLEEWQQLIDGDQAAQPQEQN